MTSCPSSITRVIPTEMNPRSKNEFVLDVELVSYGEMEKNDVRMKEEELVEKFDGELAIEVQVKENKMFDGE